MDRLTYASKIGVVATCAVITTAVVATMLYPSARARYNAWRSGQKVVIALDIKDHEI